MEKNKIELAFGVSLEITEKSGLNNGWVIKNDWEEKKRK